MLKYLKNRLIFMVGRLQIGDLEIGNIDCKNELLYDSIEEKEKFEASFLIPNNVSTDKFLNRQKFKYYFIKGVKGVGKTCLLRHIGLEIDKMSHSHNIYSSFIMFKSDLRDDRFDFAKIAKNVTKIKESDLRCDEEPDYNLLWDFIIHKHIIKTIENKNIELFKINIHWEEYYACVKATMEDETRLIPKIKQGSLKIDGKFSAFFASLNFEFQSADETADENKLIKFEELVSNINRSYKKLIHNNQYLYILFDELELNMSSYESYYRDSRLIRDLISSIGRFNSDAKRYNGCVFIIAAIRTEVLNSVAALGSEINKLCIDFGFEISWKNRDVDLNEHPILRILERRIKAAEMEHRNISTQDIWETYFPEEVIGVDGHQQDTRRYILSQTWFRPRDIIRLVLCAQKVCPNAKMFSQSVFKSLKQEYSKDSWIELCEDLIIKYEPKEIEAIRRIFTGFNREFSFGALERHLNFLRNPDSLVDRLLQKHDIKDLLEDLYRVGIIGNAYWYNEKKYYRFAYLDFNYLLIKEQIKVHDGLLPYLSIYC